MHVTYQPSFIDLEVEEEHGTNESNDDAVHLLRTRTTGSCCRQFNPAAAHAPPFLLYSGQVGTLREATTTCSRLGLCAGVTFAADQAKYGAAALYHLLFQLLNNWCYNIDDLSTGSTPSLTTSIEPAEVVVDPPIPPCNQRFIMPSSAGRSSPMRLAPDSLSYIFYLERPGG